MLQAEPVLEDLNVLRNERQGAEARLHVDAVIALARECASTPHTYLVFSPDDQPTAAGA